MCWAFISGDGGGGTGGGGVNNGRQLGPCGPAAAMFTSFPLKARSGPRLRLIPIGCTGLLGVCRGIEVEFVAMLKVSRCFVRSAHSAWSRIPRAEPLFGRNGVCQRRGARICKRFRCCLLSVVWLSSRGRSPAGLLSCCCLPRMQIFNSQCAFTCKIPT